MRTSGNSRRLLEIALIAVFCLGIYLPGAVLVGRHKMKVEVTELPRVAPTEPESALHAVIRFPRYFRRHFRISFGFRDVLVRWHALLKLRGLGVSPSRRILLGRDGWLYYWAEGEAECATAAKPFTTRQLAEWRTMLESRRDWLARRGIKFLFVVAPDKHTIYPEHLPQYVRRYNPQSRLDQLLVELRKPPGVDFADVRPGMLSVKDRYQLYYRLDTHWDQVGAFAAYRQIMLGLGRWFPQAQPMGWDSVTVTRELGRYHDLADLLGLRDGDLHETALYITSKLPRRARIVNGDPRALEIENAVIDSLVTERPGAAIPSAVVLRDSFCMSLVPYLSEHIGTATYLWTTNPDPKLIEQLHPSVVILEMTERFLMNPPPQPWRDG